MATGVGGAERYYENMDMYFARVFSNGAEVLGLGFTTGTTFYVSSAVTNGDGRSPQTASASIDTAIGLCTANKGDRIIVMPGHTETVTAAAGIALDVAGVTIIGLGRGSARPTVNFTTAVGASFAVTAANCWVENLLFTGGIDALTNPIHVQAADFALVNCEWRDVTGQATDVILTTAAADRLLIRNHRHDGATAAGTNAGIAIVGGDRIVIEGLRMDGNFAVGGIDIRTTATTDLEVRNAIFRTRNAADIFIVDTITASTGIIGPDIYMRLNDDAANFAASITGATWVFHNPISIVNAANEIGAQINASVTGFRSASTNA